MKSRRIHRTRAWHWLVRHGPDWLAPRDGLTGAYSRIAVSRIRRGSCLALADVIEMKRINDMDGFACGQLVLAAVGDRLRRLPATRVYRFGGDEFLVEAVPFANEAEARAFGEQVASTMDVPVDGVSSPVRLRVTVDLDSVGHNPELPIIMMSVQDEPDWILRARQAGACQYLVKPFAADELYASLRAATAAN